MTLLSPPTSTILPTNLISLESSERIIKSVFQRTSIWISALAYTVILYSRVGKMFDPRM